VASASAAAVSTGVVPGEPVEVSAPVGVEAADDVADLTVDGTSVGPVQSDDPTVAEKVVSEGVLHVLAVATEVLACGLVESAGKATTTSVTERDETLAVSLDLARSAGKTSAVAGCDLADETTASGSEAGDEFAGSADDSGDGLVKTGTGALEPLGCVASVAGANLDVSSLPDDSSAVGPLLDVDDSADDSSEESASATAVPRLDLSAPLCVLAGDHLLVLSDLAVNGVVQATGVELSGDLLEVALLEAAVGASSPGNAELSDGVHLVSVGLALGHSDDLALVSVSTSVESAASASEETSVVASVALSETSGVGLEVAVVTALVLGNSLPHSSSIDAEGSDLVTAVPVTSVKLEGGLPEELHSSGVNLVQASAVSGAHAGNSLAQRTVELADVATTGVETASHAAEDALVVSADTGENAVHGLGEASDSTALETAKVGPVLGAGSANVAGSSSIASAHVSVSDTSVGGLNAVDLANELGPLASQLCSNAAVRAGQATGDGAGDGADALLRSTFCLGVGSEEAVGAFGSGDLVAVGTSDRVHVEGTCAPVVVTTAVVGSGVCGGKARNEKNQALHVDRLSTLPFGSRQ